MPAIQQPCIGDDHDDCVHPGVQAPPSGFDGWFVQSTQHVKLVKTSHVHVVGLDDVWPGDINAGM